PLRAKKKWRDRLIALALGHPDGVLGFEDEVWWSRYAQPTLQTWTDTEPLRLLQNEPDRHDPEPKAVACYGLLRADTQGMLLRFVDGRPVSAVTTQLLQWVTDRLAAEGKTALLMVWDNASWHVSQAVRAWLTAHNRRMKRVMICSTPLHNKSRGLALGCQTDCAGRQTWPILEHYQFRHILPCPLQGSQEGNEIALLVLCETDLETVVVKIDHRSEICRK